MRCVFLSIFVLSSQLLSEPIEYKRKPEDQPRMEAFLEQKRQPPLKLDKRNSKGKIVEKNSSIEWQGKLGNVNVTMKADHTDPYSRLRADLESKYPKKSSSEKSDAEKKKNSNSFKHPFEEKENFGPSVNFSFTWSSDD